MFLFLFLFEKMDSYLFGDDAKWPTRVLTKTYTKASPISKENIPEIGPFPAWSPGNGRLQYFILHLLLKRWDTDILSYWLYVLFLGDFSSMTLLHFYSNWLHVLWEEKWISEDYKVFFLFIPFPQYSLWGLVQGIRNQSDQEDIFLCFSILLGKITVFQW